MVPYPPCKTTIPEHCHHAFSLSRSRSLPRIAGHKEGINSVREITRICGEIGVKYLTLYTFSTENWSRSNEEVDYLMFFNRDLLTRRRDEFNEKGVRFHFIGDLKDKMIPDENKHLMSETQSITRGNEKLNLVFAFNYGSEKEIYTAARRVALNHWLYFNLGAWFFTQQYVEENFKKYLYLPEMPNPDLLIRTAGEKRLSNFLLWQLAYSELYFVNKLWPDFTVSDYGKIINNFKKVKRNFGNI